MMGIQTFVKPHFDLKGVDRPTGNWWVVNAALIKIGTIENRHMRNCQGRSLFRGEKNQTVIHSEIWLQMRILCSSKFSAAGIDKKLVRYEYILSSGKVSLISFS